MNPNRETWDMFADIAAITRWLDANTPDSPQEDATRVMKAGEEIEEAYRALAVIDVAFGRAVTAYIGFTGENPRKGVTHTLDELATELADIAITAMCAIAHFYPVQSPLMVRAFMAAKITEIIKRSDIQPIDPPIRPHEYVYDGSGPVECTYTELTGEKCAVSQQDHRRMYPPATKPRETDGMSVLSALHTVDTEGL